MRRFAWSIGHKRYERAHQAGLRVVSPAVFPQRVTLQYIPINQLITLVKF